MAMIGNTYSRPTQAFYPPALAAPQFPPRVHLCSAPTPIPGMSLSSPPIPSASRPSSWAPPSAADRVSVHMEGVDDVARNDGVGNCAIGPLIQVQRLDSEEAGVDCVRALI